MTNYLITAKAEVLYEKTFSVLAKYVKYLEETQEPLERYMRVYQIIPIKLCFVIMKQAMIY